MPEGKRWSPIPEDFRRPQLVTKPHLAFPSEITAKAIHRSVDSSRPVSDETIRQELESAYLRVGRGLYRRQLGTLGNCLRLAANWVQREGVSPKGIVSYLCATLAKLNSGKFPMPHIVFSLRTLRGFLPGYRREEASYIESASIRSASLKRAQRVEWLKRIRNHGLAMQKAWAERDSRLAQAKIARGSMFSKSIEEIEHAAIRVQLQAIEKHKLLLKEQSEVLDWWEAQNHG